MRKQTLIVFVLLLTGGLLQAQRHDSTGFDLAHFPTNYLDKINVQADRLDKQLDARTDKYLGDIAASERSLKNKLHKIDPAAADNLFGDVEARYKKLKTGAVTGSGNPGSTSVGVYVPSLDTLKNTLQFLQTNRQLLNSVPGLDESKLSGTLAKVQVLEGKLGYMDNLKSQLDQRKQFLNEQLGRFGMSKDLQQLNQHVYYYKQQLNDLKTTLKDPSSISQKAVAVLTQIPAYKSFIRQNSFLGSLFGQPESYNLSDSGLNGLQTRASVQKMVQDKVGAGGPAAESQVTQQVAQAGGAMNELKNKFTQLAGQSDLADPGFKPNSQKTRSLWKRIEYGANLQFEPSGRFLPTLCDLALSLGYRLNDDGTIGIGMAYKAGLGNGIQNIHFSSEGLGLRSYIDWRLKKSYYLSGGYEQNYLSSFASLSQLRVPSSWQKSGLVGLSRKYRISNKLNGKIQLLFDFLSYSQIPKAQPILFRVGWTL